MYRLIDFRPVDAHQWHKNGDHPCDDIQQRMDRDTQEVFLTEGKVVRRFAHPNMDGENYCAKCRNRSNLHGWIDQRDEGLTVCPGDWVVSMGPEYLVLSDHNFQALFYSTISGGTPPEPMQAVSYSNDKPVEPRVASVRQAWENITTLAGAPQEPTNTNFAWCGDPGFTKDEAVAHSGEPTIQELKDMDQNRNKDFELDKIVAEFDMSYMEIAPNVMACALVHQGANFTVTGLASCLDPDQYDMKRAKEHAYNDAASKVHQFEQYRKGMNQFRRMKDAHEESMSPSIALKAPTPFGGEFDIGTARRHLMDGRKVAHRDWDDADVSVFYVPPGKYPASRNGNGTLLGLYPDDMVPYDGYLAMKTKSGSVVPWQPTMYDMLKVGWYLVE